ncbi:MAG TPA: hypothetical protein VFB60_05175 [Ktedonobacteraceae bacterium]|nr:hypothetical protein [Ktedonobacteraceae bacterium]
MRFLYIPAPGAINLAQAGAVNLAPTEIEETAPPANGGGPVSFSLTLSGGFDMVSIADFHSLGSLFDDFPVYWSWSARSLCSVHCAKNTL